MFSKLKKMFHDRLHRKSLYCTSAYWDSKADDYTSTAVSKWPNTALNEYYHKEFTELINSLNLNYTDLNVLDLGCGTGIYSRWFASQGAIVKGVDFSSKAIQIAQQNNLNNNITYQVSSVYELNETKKYDLIFISCVLTVACKSSNDIIIVFNKLKQIISENGHIFLCEPIHKGFLSRVLNLNIKDFTNIMVEQGFIICSLKSIHFWPIRLFLSYLPLPKFITFPFFYLGCCLIKLPLLSKLGDYWCILARI
jgi:2-polyprenyl-3-methyl-5-hydroxy-6-metoxy-1,4-benzoquinol methylase